MSRAHVVAVSLKEALCRQVLRGNAASLPTDRAAGSTGGIASALCAVSVFANIAAWLIRSTASIRVFWRKLNLGRWMSWQTTRAWSNCWHSMAQACACRTPKPSVMVCLSCVRAGVLALGAPFFYCFLLGKRIIVVHAFIKKTQETPDKELKLARKRVKELPDD
jgi:hypothetical protein